MLKFLTKLPMIDTIAKIAITLVLGVILIGILPVSPFRQFINSIGAIPYMGYVNWFFPVGQCLTILTAWVAAIAIFYGISWILRQLNIIGS